MTDTNSKKVLICDDEEGIRESLKLILSDQYDLVLTDSGEQCMDVLTNDPTIGLVLLDIKMPKINGLEILKAVKEKRPELNVIIVTEAASLGAADYIVKPFKSEEILKTVASKLS